MDCWKIFGNQVVFSKILKSVMRIADNLEDLKTYTKENSTLLYRSSEKIEKRLTIERGRRRLWVWHMTSQNA
jgi:hypothetical protein